MTSYKGITIDQYNDVLKEYSRRMFNLFDKDRSFNSRKGDSLMWLGGFTSKFCAKDTIDLHISHNMELFEAFIEVLKKACPGASYNLDNLVSSV